MGMARKQSYHHRSVNLKQLIWRFNWLDSSFVQLIGHTDQGYIEFFLFLQMKHLHFL